MCDVQQGGGSEQRVGSRTVQGRDHFRILEVDGADVLRSVGISP